MFLKIFLSDGQQRHLHHRQRQSRLCCVFWPWGVAYGVPDTEAQRELDAYVEDTIVRVTDILAFWRKKTRAVAKVDQDGAGLSCHPISLNTYRALLLSSP